MKIDKVKGYHSKQGDQITVSIIYNWMQICHEHPQR